MQNNIPAGFNSTDPLTIRAARALCTVLDYAARGAKIKWTDDNGDTIKHGTARRLVSPNGIGHRLEDVEDVRDALLHITLWSEGASGEVFVPVRDLMMWSEIGALYLAGQR